MSTIARNDLSEAMVSMFEDITVAYDLSPAASNNLAVSSSSVGNETQSVYIYARYSTVGGPGERLYHHLLGWSYVGYPSCCGFGIMSNLKYRGLEKRKAGKLAKAFGKYCKERYGRGQGLSMMWHAVSEQEKGYQHPFLRAAGFKKAKSVVSMGTNHKLSMVSLDLRSEERIERCESEYERRYSSRSIYQLGQGQF